MNSVLNTGMDAHAGELTAEHAAHDTTSQDVILLLFLCFLIG